LEVADSVNKGETTAFGTLPQDGKRAKRTMEKKDVSRPPFPSEGRYFTTLLMSCILKLLAVFMSLSMVSVFRLSWTAPHCLLVVRLS
jgi:hypothetical protein